MEIKGVSAVSLLCLTSAGHNDRSFHVLGCNDSRVLFEREGSQPTFSYQVNETMLRSYPRDIRLVYFDGMISRTLFKIRYLFTLLDYFESFYNTSKMTTYNASTGQIDLQLESFVDGDEGLYYFTERYTSTILQCTFIYILGKPERPTIEIKISQNGGEDIEMTCKSNSTTAPTNHSLTMLYSWAVDGVTNPTDKRYSYSPTRHILTISSALEEDALKAFVCQSKENVTNGLSSDNSIAAPIGIKIKNKSERSRHTIGGIIGGTLGGLFVGSIGTLAVLFLVRRCSSKNFFPKTVIAAAESESNVSSRSRQAYSGLEEPQNSQNTYTEIGEPAEMSDNKDTPEYTNLSY